MRARYYDPFTQQFISRDPMETVSGQPYVYGNASPNNYVDPDGNLAFLAVFALFVGANIATDVGMDLIFDNANFSLGTSLGNGFGNVGNYIPVPGVGKVSTVMRLAAKSAAIGAARRTLANGVPNIRDEFVSQREARRAAMKDAGIGRNGPRKTTRVPLDTNSQSPTGPRGTRTEWENISNGYRVHHDPYGNNYPDGGHYIGPHYGVTPLGGPTTHYMYPSTHDPRLNR